MNALLYFNVAVFLLALAAVAVGIFYPTGF
jgi:hypothetical protein